MIWEAPKGPHWQKSTEPRAIIAQMNKISVITDILILEFYKYIRNIGGYFDKNIAKAKINKNTLKFMKILC